MLQQDGEASAYIAIEKSCCKCSWVPENNLPVDPQKIYDFSSVGRIPFDDDAITGIKVEHPSCSARHADFGQCSAEKTRLYFRLSNFSASSQNGLYHTLSSSPFWKSCNVSSEATFASCSRALEGFSSAGWSDMTNAGLLLVICIWRRELSCKGKRGMLEFSCLDWRLRRALIQHLGGRRPPINIDGQINFIKQQKPMCLFAVIANTSPLNSLQSAAQRQLERISSNKNIGWLRYWLPLANNINTVAHIFIVAVFQARTSEWLPQTLNLLLVPS